MDDNVCPDDVHCDEQVFDMCFHPKTNIFAAGLITGSIDVFKYFNEEPAQKIMDLRHHSQSCRGVAFHDSGECLFSISSDRSLAAINTTGQPIFHIENAHMHPINKLLTLDENCIATGDDVGVVKIWDVRSGKETMTYHLHEDFISGLCYEPERNTLLSVGGDAFLCIYDLRKKNCSTKSEEQEAELHCVHVMKHGRKVVCGTQDGVMLVFTWDRWLDCSDRYPGHPQTVDCMLKIDESTMFTGSSDGLIRVVTLQPNKILGVIGDHEEFPVEGMSRSFDGRVLGSYAHDNVVRFWDISMFVGDVDETPDEDPEEGTGEMTMEGNRDEGEEVDEDGSEQWEDMSESTEENFSDDSDDDSDAGKTAGLKIPTAAEKFYADL